MFTFCAGKPFVYYSRYVPSPRIYALAAKHHIRLLHVPLRQIPAALLERNRYFRFLEMSPDQWTAFLHELEAQSLWDMVAALRRHFTEPAA